MSKVRLKLQGEMFKFNFNAEPKTVSKQDDSNQEAPQYEPALQIVATETICEFAKSCANYELCKCGGITMKHISPRTVLDYLNKHDIKSSIVAAESSHSDLLSGVYEGGLKVWECTYDLLNHLEKENINFCDKNVLDLGCGAGLLGIYALSKGASFVAFQDYNKEVLEYTTIPNILLNGFATEKFSCFSGDWDSFLNLYKDSFDYILTSETIYNIKNYRKLLDVFKKYSKKDSIIFVAAKSYYFGVGGGVQEFQKDVEKQGYFSVSNVWRCEEGIKRQILKMRLLN